MAAACLTVAAAAAIGLAAAVHPCGDACPAADRLRTVVGPRDLVGVATTNSRDLAPFEGLPAVGLSKISRRELRGFDRIYLAGPADRLSALVGSRVFRGAKRIVSERHGRFGVVGFEVDALKRPSYDFVEGIGAARVSLRHPDGRIEPCPRRRRRHVCPRFKHAWVGKRSVEVSGRRVECIWAHPYRGAVLRIEFPSVPRASKVEGRIALSDAAVRHAGAAPVHFRVEAGGLGASFVAPNRRGFTPFTLDLAKRGGPSIPGTVAFEIRADNTGARHFCFDALALE
jgi:hypothetical protein